jgi:hypothetical protein
MPERKFSSGVIASEGEAISAPSWAEIASSLRSSQELAMAWWGRLILCRHRARRRANQ